MHFQLSPRSFVITKAVLTGMFLVIVGCSREDGPTIIAYEGDGLSMNKASLVFVSVDPGEVAKGIVQFVNKEPLPVTLKSVKGSCTCMDIEFPKKPIPSGMTGKIQLRIRTAGQSESTVTRSLVISYESSGRMREQAILISVPLKLPQLSAVPKAISLGPLCPGTRFETSVMINMQRGSDDGIGELDITNSPTWLTATFEPSPDNHSSTMHVVGVAPNRQDRIVDFLSIVRRAGGNGNFNQLRIPIELEVTAGIVFEPKALVEVVSSKDAFEESGYRVQIRHQNSTPIHLLSYTTEELDKDDVNVIVESNNSPVVVWVKPQSRKKVVRGVLLFKIQSDESNNNVTVRYPVLFLS